MSHFRDFLSKIKAKSMEEWLRDDCRDGDVLKVLKGPGVTVVQNGRSREWYLLDAGPADMGAAEVKTSDLRHLAMEMRSFRRER
jgi:hypothetical protein